MGDRVRYTVFLCILLLSINSYSEDYTVGCYGEDGTRTTNGLYGTFEEAEDTLDEIKTSDPDFDCDIQEKVEEEDEAK